MRGGPLPVWGRLLGLALLVCAPGLPALAAGPGPGAALDLETVVRQTLARNPAILLQERQVEAARGGMQQSAGQFDPVLQLTARRSREQEPLNAYYRKLYRASYGEQGGVDAIQSDTSGLSLGLDKPLRNGMVLSTSLGHPQRGDPQRFPGLGTPEPGQGGLQHQHSPPEGQRPGRCRRGAGQ